MSEILNNIQKKKALFLISKDDPCLSAVAEEIPKNQSVIPLAKSMIEIMRSYNGVGLSAPQVGKSIRLIVIEYQSSKLILINPVIVKNFKKKTTSLKEGCLSYPKKFKDMQRYKRIIIEGFDLNWKPVRYDVRGTLSFIFQHEIDHLNGITIGNQ